MQQLERTINFRRLQMFNQSSDKIDKIIIILALSFSHSGIYYLHRTIISIISQALQEINRVMIGREKNHLIEKKKHLLLPRQKNHLWMSDSAYFSPMIQVCIVIIVILSCYRVVVLERNKNKKYWTNYNNWKGSKNSMNKNWWKTYSNLKEKVYNRIRQLNQ